MVEFVDSGFSLVLLFGVALLGGVINGVAGGGGLIVFPTLLFTGMPAIEANATNTASLWVGTVASTVAYRKELISLRRELLLLTITSVTGGILGAQILLHTPQATFTALLPYLMLTATVVFAFGQPLIRWLRRHSSARSSTQTEYHLPLVLALLLQFGIAIYIGFFWRWCWHRDFGNFGVDGIEKHPYNERDENLASCLHQWSRSDYLYCGSCRALVAGNADG